MFHLIAAGAASLLAALGTGEAFRASSSPEALSPYVNVGIDMTEGRAAYEAPGATQERRGNDFGPGFEIRAPGVKRALESS
jgi:hypothetical protein